MRHKIGKKNNKPKKDVSLEIDWFFDTDALLTEIKQFNDIIEEFEIQFEESKDADSILTKRKLYNDLLDYVVRYIMNSDFETFDYMADKLKEVIERDYF